MSNIWEHAAALIPLVPVLAIPAWSAWKVVVGLRAGDWRRPGWFGHAAWASFVLAVLAWLWGAARPGLDFGETCTLRHGQPYDDAYREAHWHDDNRIFPLSLKCNASYDMVPAWVNPTVAVFFLLFAISVVGLVWATGQRLRQRLREQHGRP